MAELTLEPNSTGSENKIKNKKSYNERQKE
jgi:hypothetical protein